MDAKISLARIYYPVRVLGPGRRVGIWMNGCSRNCEGCISPELQDYDESREISVVDVIRMVQQIQDPIDGFTISGGEPFYHPDDLDVLVRSLVKINDDILIFTGYRLEELTAINNKAINSVLENCAVLIDGPYIDELNDSKGLRGSSNQRFWFFKHREKYNDIEYADRSLQSIIYGNNVLMIGIPQGEIND